MTLDNKNQEPKNQDAKEKIQKKTKDQRKNTNKKTKGSPKFGNPLVILAWNLFCIFLYLFVYLFFGSWHLGSFLITSFTKR